MSVQDVELKDRTPARWPLSHTRGPPESPCRPEESRSPLPTGGARRPRWLPPAPRPASPCRGPGSWPRPPGRPCRARCHRARNDCCCTSGCPAHARPAPAALWPACRLAVSAPSRPHCTAPPRPRPGALGARPGPGWSCCASPSRPATGDRRGPVGGAAGRAVWPRGHLPPAPRPHLKQRQVVLQVRGWLVLGVQDGRPGSEGEAGVSESMEPQH